MHLFSPSNASRSAPLASLLMLAPFFLWGTTMVAMKGTLPHTTPLFLAGVRLVPAGILVLVAASLMGRSQPQGWKAWMWIAVFALVDGTLFQGFLAEGLTRTDAGIGSVTIDSQPIAVALLSHWLFGERIGFWGFLGLGAGLLGILTISLPEAFVAGLFDFVREGATGNTFSGGADLWQAFTESGEWMMVLAALAMATGTVVVRLASRHVDPVVATGWHMILGGLPLWALSAGLETNCWSQLNGTDALALGYTAIGGSAISFGLFFYFAAKGNLTSLSALTFLTPVFALLFGSLFLGETLTPIQIAGIGSTFIGIYCINQREALANKFAGKLAAVRKLAKTYLEAILYSRYEA